MGAGKLKRDAAKAELEQRWEGLDRLPDTHLSWHRTGSRKWDLATRSGEVRASVDSERFAVGEGTYEARVEDHEKWLVDEAGCPVLHFEGRHCEVKADRMIWLSGSAHVEVSSYWALESSHHVRNRHHPATALRMRPTRTAVAKMPSIIVIRPSARRTGLSSAAPVLALPRKPRPNMTAAVTPVQTMPSGLWCGWNPSLRSGTAVPSLNTLSRKG